MERRKTRESVLNSKIVVDKVVSIPLKDRLKYYFQCKRRSYIKFYRSILFVKGRSLLTAHSSFQMRDIFCQCILLYLLKLDAFTALPEPSWHCLAPILSLENQERKCVCMCACTHLVMALFKMHSAFSKDTDTQFFTARKRSCGKVMFSQVSVCHSVQGRG